MMFPHIQQQLTDKMGENHQRAIIGIQRQHYQQATHLHQSITGRDNHIPAIQYENVGLLVEIRNARQTGEDLIENRQIIMTICFVWLKKNREREMDQAGEHTYYMVRCQKRVLPTHNKWLEFYYPNII